MVSVNGIDETAVIEINDARGSTIQRLHASGPSMVLSTTSLRQGVYQVMTKGANGTSCIGRFVVAR